MIGKTTSGVSPLIHERKTLIATAGSPWAVGGVDVFTITGRVLVHRITAYCTETLVGAGDVLLGTANAIAFFHADTQGPDLLTDTWWGSDGNEYADGVNINAVANPAQFTNPVSKALSADIIVTIQDANITDGTIVFDVWYEPITDNGALAAA